MNAYSNKQLQSYSTSAKAKQPWYRKIHTTFLATGLAALTYLSGAFAAPQQEPQQPPAAAQQEKKQDLQQPAPQKTAQEIALESEAKAVYDLASALPSEKEGFPLYLEALVLYKKAEDANPANTAYALDIKRVRDCISRAYFEKPVALLAADQRAKLETVIEDYVAGKKPVLPGSAAARAQQQEDRRARHAKTAYVRAQTQQDAFSSAYRKDLPFAYQFYREAEDKDPRTADFTQELDTIISTASNGIYSKKTIDLAENERANVLRFLTQMQDPYETNRIIARGELGSEKSSRDTSASVDARMSGVHALAEWHRNKFRENASKDKIVEQGFGAYAAIDFERMADLLFDFSASEDVNDRKRTSSEFSETDDAQFNIKSMTDLEEKQHDQYRAASVGFTLDTFRLRGTVFTNEKTIDVDGTTRVDVINKLDPSGNYTTFTPFTEHLEEETQGIQAGLEYRVSDDLLVGALLTGETIDLPDQDRTISVFPRAHVYSHYLSADGRRGISALIGESHLDDTGEEQDGWKKGEYNIVAGAELSDWLTFGGQFSYLENPRGSFWFLLGESDRALEHLLSKYWLENQSEIKLLRQMSPDQQNIYLQGRHQDLIRALAQQNTWLAFADLGGGRTQTFVNGVLEDKNVFNGNAALFAPLSQDVTLVVEPYQVHERVSEGFGLPSKRQGIRTTLFPIHSPWTFGVDIAKETVDGRLQEEEDVRAFIELTYTLGK